MGISIRLLASLAKVASFFSGWVCAISAKYSRMLDSDSSPTNACGWVVEGWLWVSVSGLCTSTSRVLR